MFAFPNDERYVSQLPLATCTAGDTNFFYDFSFRSNYPKHVGKLMKRVLAAPDEWAIIAAGRNNSRDIGQLAAAIVAAGLIPKTIHNIAVIHPTENGAMLNDVWQMVEKTVSAGALFAYDGAWAKEHVDVGDALVPDGFFSLEKGRPEYTGTELTDDLTCRLEETATRITASHMRFLCNSSKQEDIDVGQAVSMLGYGIVPVPPRLNVMPPETPPRLLISRDSPLFSRLDDSYSMAMGLAWIWHCFFDSLPAKIQFRGTLDENLDFAAQIGLAYGIDNYVKALVSGVPLHDCAGDLKKYRCND